MSQDLTDKLPKTDSEKLNLILTTTRNLERRFNDFEGRFNDFEGRFGDFEGRFEKLETRVDGIDSRLEHLEQSVEQRLHDTRPIWHKVVADIAHLQAGQDAMREQIGELSSTVREVNRDQIVINDSLRRIQLDLRTFDERLHRCEMNRRPHT